MQEIIGETKHALLLPFATLLGGKATPMNIVVSFTVTDDGSLTGIDEVVGVSITTARRYDLSYLKDEDSELFVDLVDLIFGNQAHWGIKKPWW